MANLFDFTHCPGAPTSPQKIASWIVIQNCAVPAVPAPIYLCPNPPLSPPGPVGPPGFDVFGGRFAVSGPAGLSAYNAATRTLGSGQVVLQHVDPATGQMVDDMTITAYTDSPSGVPGSTPIQVKAIEGLFVVDVQQCPGT